LVKDWKNIDEKTKAILIVIGILFNPIATIYLSKLVWVPIDFICGYYLRRENSALLLKII
jgi:hypothetical protein